MKSLINLNKLRAHRGSTLAEVYLYGKVLYLLLVHAGANFSLVYAVKGRPAYVHLNGLAIVRLK